MEFIVKTTPVSKKNSMRIVRNKKTEKPYLIPSEKYVEYEKIAMYYMPSLAYPIDYSVNVKCLFYMPTKRKCDLTNMLEAIDDVMVKSGILEDDNCSIVVGHDGSRVLYDKNNPRTEVTITEMNEITGFEKE